VALSTNHKSTTVKTYKHMSSPVYVSSSSYTHEQICIIPNVFTNNTGLANVCNTNLKKVSKCKFCTQNNKPKQHIPEKKQGM